MANRKRKEANASGKPRKLTYFFLNGDLHRSIRISRPTDEITAWSYPARRRIGYTYSDVRRRRGKAFTTQQVSQMINRSRVKIQECITLGHIEPPQFTYNLDTYHRTGETNIYKYMWSEDDVLGLHDYFSTVHYGRPRKDGLVTPWPMPNKRELRALMKHDEILYVKQGDTFVPVWEVE